MQISHHSVNFHHSQAKQVLDTTSEMNGRNPFPFLATFPVIFFFLSITTPPTLSKTNQEPVNIGFIFSLPWDISNTLRAPIAGPLSIVLTSAFALICFAGLLFAPIWWLFGYPPRRYHMHSVPKDDDKRSFNNNPYFFLLNETLTQKSWMNDSSSEKGRGLSQINYPDFAESLFLFVPPFDENCEKLLACHSHGFLPLLPESWVRIYHFFSKRILNLTPEYRNAVLAGLDDQGSCMHRYKSCTQDIVTLAKSTLFYNIPQGLREQWQLEIMP